MRVLIIYDSKTGNIEKVAQEISKSFEGKADLMSFKDFSNSLKPAHYEYILVGFELNQSKCTKQVKDFLKTLANCKVGLFTTVCADPESPYVLEIVENTVSFLPASSFYIGDFSCRGKIDPNVIKILEQKYDKTKDEAIKEIILEHKLNDNHPDANDLDNARMFFKRNTTLN